MSEPVRTRALEEAAAIGDAIGKRLDRDGAIGVRGLAFGHGSAGVALLYAHLYVITGDSEFGRRAERLACQVSDGLDRIEAKGGWMEGRLGAAVALLQTAHLLERDDLESTSVRALEQTGGLDRGDVYAGLSGAVLAALRAAAVLGDRAWITRAEVWAAELIQKWIRPRADGAVLLSDRAVLFPLLGYAHGAAGCAFALAALGHAASEPLYLYLARALLAYEDRWYRPEWQNWPDGRMRPEDARAFDTRGDTRSRFLRPAHPTAWCSGKSGLLAPRLVALYQWRLVEMSSGLGTEKMRDPIWRWSGRGIQDHTMCCGFGGAIELHLLAWRLLGHPRFERYVVQCLEELYELKQATGDWIASWRRERSGAQDGFLKGRAGIGYMLLRVGDPTGVPSQLLLGADTIEPGCSGGSALLDAYRRRLLRSYWSILDNDALSAIVPQHLDRHAARSVADDVAAFNTLLRSTNESLVPTAALDAVEHRQRLELDQNSVLATRDDVRELGIAAAGLDYYVLAPDAATFECSEQTFIVARRGAFGMIAVVSSWGRLLLRLLATPTRFDSLLDHLQCVEHSPPVASRDLAAILEKLRAAGAVRAQAIPGPV